MYPGPRRSRRASGRARWIFADFHRCLKIFIDIYRCLQTFEDVHRYLCSWFSTKSTRERKDESRCWFASYAVRSTASISIFGCASSGGEGFGRLFVFFSEGGPRKGPAPRPTPPGRLLRPPLPAFLFLRPWQRAGQRRPGPSASSAAAVEDRAIFGIRFEPYTSGSR